MEKQSATPVNWAVFPIAVLILIGLYLAGLYNYLLFHSLVEVFSIFVAAGIFMVAWNSRRFMENNYLLFLGIAYLFIACLDLVHTLAYRGMGVFTGFGTNLPTQLWISARYMESISLFAAPFFITRKVRERHVLAAYSLALALILLSIFYWKIFPDCFVEGSGLTLFKKTSEYVIALILTGAMILLRKNQSRFDKNIFRLLTASITLTICSELAFTFYISDYGISNLTGHMLKIISFYLIYRSIIASGLIKPYSLLFRNLKQREEELFNLNLELEKRVEQRTAELQREVIERRRAQKEVSNIKTRLQAVFDGISDPLLLMDESLNLKILNAAAVEYYGKSRLDVLDMPCHQALRENSQPCENCNIVPLVKHGRHGVYERQSFIRPGRLERVVIYPVKEHDNETGSSIVRLHDITESKMMEKQLIQSEKLASLGVLISGIAHEINNPNNYISVNMPILKDYLNIIMPIVDQYAREHPDLEIMHMPYPEFRADVFELLENVQHGSRQIKTIVQDLKAFSKTEEDNPVEKIDLKPVVEKVVAFCKSKIRATVKNFNVRMPENLPQVCVDPQPLRQILINLLTNAAQAFESPVKDDSTVDLIFSTAAKGENCLVIEVRDNGRGMDEKTLGKIFDPFFTTKQPEEGTGLGMYIVHNLIQKINGRIEVESRVGQGSNFRVILGM